MNDPAIHLTPEQQAVLDYELQPLRIVAGAGTGKTFILAHRVAELMLRHQIEPEQVLGVTFTNKAAYEISHRIREILGGESSGDASRDVNVFTYHGFAYEILNTYGALVGVERGSRIITPTVTRELLHRCILQTEYEVLETTHLPTVTRYLMALEEEMAANLVRPEQLLQNLLGADSPDNEVVAKRADLARTLITYQETKQEMNLLDYGDLLSKAVQLVQEHPEIAQRVQQGYLLVVLDEYQDTDPAQRKLFSTLFGTGAAVTAVGDPDQTIFEWRGASRHNFEAFPKDFLRTDRRRTKTLGLSLNFRSGQMILDLANQTRRMISDPTPTTQSKDLHPLPGANPGTVSVSWHPDFRQEAQAIADQARSKNEQGVSWSEMAVLFRKNKDMEAVRAALEANQIPYQVADLGGLLHVPEVIDLIAWLRLVNDPEDDPALLRILLGSHFRLGLTDLQPLAQWVREPSGDTDRPSKGHKTMLEALDHLNDLEMPNEARGRLEEFRNLYQEILVQAQAASLTELARQVLSLTGAWHEIEALPPATRLTARLNLYYFLDLTEQWAPLEGRRSLAGFITHLRMIEDVPHEEPDVARIGGGDAITLITVHRAKGLEWKVVFLPALYKRNFPTQPRALSDPKETHYTLPYDMIIDPLPRQALGSISDREARREWLRERHYQQEWRLAYVAVTRAMQDLYLSGAFWYDQAEHPEPKKKADQPSELLQIARRLPGSAKLVWTRKEPERPESLTIPRPERPTDPDLGISWDEVLRQVMEDPHWSEHQAQELSVEAEYDKAMEEMNQVLFSLPEPEEPTHQDSPLRTSVTSLVTYAQCPKRFFWSEVDRLPRRPPGRSMKRGIELHRKIELHNRGAVPFEELSEVTYDRTPDEDEPDHQRPSPSPESGWKAFENSSYAKASPIKIEVPFELPMSADASVRGRVDAVYQDEQGGWEIVDWKSGMPSARPEALVQLQAYALAAQAECLGSPVPESLTVSFVYLGDGLQVDSHQVDQKWSETAQDRLDELIAGIRTEQFTPTPSDACRGCDFFHVCPEGQSHQATSSN